MVNGVYLIHSTLKKNNGTAVLANAIVAELKQNVKAGAKNVTVNIEKKVES